MIEIPRPFWRDEFVTSIQNVKILKEQIESYYEKFRRDVESLVTKCTSTSNPSSMILDDEEDDTTSLSTMVFTNSSLFPQESKMAEVGGSSLEESFPLTTPDKLLLTETNFPDTIPSGRQEKRETSPHSWVEVVKRSNKKPIIISNASNDIPTSNMFAILNENAFSPDRTESSEGILSTKKKKSVHNRLTISEVDADIIKVPNSTSIAFFMDEKFSKKNVGIAKRIDGRFHVADVLEAQMKKVGQVAIAKYGKRYVLGIIVKRAANESTSIQNLTRALETLKKVCQLLNIEHLALPKVGASVSGLPYSEFKRNVRQIFDSVALKISVHARQHFKQINRVVSINVSVPRSSPNFVDNRERVEFSRVEFSQQNIAKGQSTKPKRKIHAQIEKTSSASSSVLPLHRRKDLTFRDFLKESGIAKCEEVEIDKENIINWPSGSKHEECLADLHEMQDNDNDSCKLLGEFHFAFII